MAGTWHVPLLTLALVLGLMGFGPCQPLQLHAQPEHGLQQTSMSPPQNVNCSFAVHGRRYDLRGAGLLGAKFTTRHLLESRSWFDLSVCGNLNTSCVDSLTGAKINGSVYSYFRGSTATPAAKHCWDTLADTTHVTYAALADPATDGFAVNFSRPFDAHLGCAVVAVNVAALCDRSAPPGGLTTGGQIPDVCVWNFVAKDARFCHRSHAVRSASSPAGGGDGDGAGDSRPWMDRSKTVQERVDLLLPQMTIAEKIAQLNRPNKVTDALLESGVGLLMHTTYCCAGARNATDVVRRRNDLQRQFLSRGVGQRLGIPASWRSFFNHGAAAFGVTFPVAAALGTSWDVRLVHEVAQANAAAARAIGLDMEWYVMNLWADPRFGRINEGFSEEPTLTSAMVAAVVNGSQGGLGLPDGAYIDGDAVVPTFWKHCCGYGAASGGLNGAPAQITEHTAREVYIKPWRRARASGARGVMPSHQTLLNVPCHANRWLLDGVLRTELDWPLAYILSDVADVSQLQAFRVAADPADAAAKALLAGVDVAQNDPCFAPLADAIKRGAVNESSVDAAARRVLTHKFSSGLFDTPYTNVSLAASFMNSPWQRDVAFRAAAAGCVLLINNPAPGQQPPLLPLDASRKQKIAVVGPNGGCGLRGSGTSGTLCDAQVNMLGSYAESIGPPSGIPTVFDAFAAGGAAVSFNRGADIDVSPEGNAVPNGNSLLPPAVAAAKAADVVVAVVGDSATSCGESRDRDDLDPAGTQMALLRAVAALGKPLVVVAIGCRPLTFGAADGNALLGNITALLAAWRPGSEGGRAIVDLLYGKAEPSGRLAQNWLRSAAQAGSTASPWMQERRSAVGLYGGEDGAEHRRYSAYTHGANPSTPLFNFGFGLSYGHHRLSGLSVAVSPLPPGPSSALGGGNATALLATLTVTSLTGRAAPAVVQLYIQDPPGVAMHVRPWKRLIGFAKVDVPGNTQVDLAIPVRADDLAFPGDDMRLAIHAGNYTVSAGFSSSGDAGTTAAVHVPATRSLQRTVARPHMYLP